MSDETPTPPEPSVFASPLTKQEQAVNRVFNLKQSFLRTFRRELVVTDALREIQVKRDVYDGWLKDDALFAKRVRQVENEIDDMALDIMYRETGLKQGIRKRRKRPIDRTLLRDLVKHHPRFKPPDEREAEKARGPQPMAIKGLDPKVIVQLVGGNVNISVAPSELAQESAPAALEIQTDQPSEGSA